MRKAIASSKSTSSALADAWPSQLTMMMMTRVNMMSFQQIIIRVTNSDDNGVHLGVEALIWASHCSWEIAELPGGAKRGKRQLENS